MTDLLKPYLTQSVKSLAERTCVHTSADIPNLLSLYHDDLPTPTSLDTELYCWGVKWSDAELLEEAKV